MKKRLKELLRMHNEEAKWFNNNGEYLPIFDNIINEISKDENETDLMSIVESLIICLSVYDVKTGKVSFLILDIIVDVCRYYSKKLNAEYEDIADFFYDLEGLSIENQALLYKYISKRKHLTLIQ